MKNANPWLLAFVVLLILGVLYAIFRQPVNNALGFKNTIGQDFGLTKNELRKFTGSDFGLGTGDIIATA